MRILELINAPVEGGAHTLVAGLARQWRADGHEVDIFALDPAPNEVAAKRSRELFGHDVRVVRPRSRLLGHFPAKQLSRLVGLRFAIQKGRYDVVHAHSMQPNIYSRMASIGVRGSPPVVVTMHAPERADYRARRVRVAERMLAGRTSAVIAVSAQTAREYGDMFAATAPKLVVIPNGIPRAVAPRIGFAAEPTRFLALSRIHPQKDIETMIRGFDRFLAESSVSAELAIAGAFDVSDYETKVRLVHRDLAFRDRIRFLGSRNDVLDLLANSDVFVHTALFEAHSISILEAAAGALPIVASDLPSIRESIGSRAEYFRPGDAEGLSDALHRTVGSWPAPAQVAHELARVVNSRYSMLACANAHLEVIGAAARSRGSLGSRGS